MAEWCGNVKMNIWGGGGTIVKDIQKCDPIFDVFILKRRLLFLYSLRFITLMFFVYIYFLFTLLYMLSRYLSLHMRSFRILYIFPCNCPDLENLKKFYCMVLVIIHGMVRKTKNWTCRRGGAGNWRLKCPEMRPNIRTNRINKFVQTVNFGQKTNWCLSRIK